VGLKSALLKNFFHLSFFFLKFFFKTWPKIYIGRETILDLDLTRDGLEGVVGGDGD
jgi:hypothetical protein